MGVFRCRKWPPWPARVRIGFDARLPVSQGRQLAAAAEDWRTDLYNNAILPRVVALDTSRLSYTVTWPEVVNQPGKPDNWPGSKVNVTVTCRRTRTLSDWPHSVEQHVVHAHHELATQIGSLCPKEAHEDRIHHASTRRRGTVAMFVAICLTVIVGMVAISIDGGMR